MAYQRPNKQPGLIGKFIENVREGLSRNKDMQVRVVFFFFEEFDFSHSPISSVMGT